MAFICQVWKFCSSKFCDMFNKSGHVVKGVLTKVLLHVSVLALFTNDDVELEGCVIEGSVKYCTPPLDSHFSNINFEIQRLLYVNKLLLRARALCAHF